MNTASRIAFRFVGTAILLRRYVQLQTDEVSRLAAGIVSSTYMCLAHGSLTMEVTRDLGKLSFHASSAGCGVPIDATYSSDGPRSENGPALYRAARQARLD